MVTIRAVRPKDLGALYAVSLATGFRGGDASALYADPNMLGHIYAVPYVVLEPRLALVAEDAEGVAGFAVGVTDTTEWEDRLEREWWPQLRQRYPDPPETRRKSWSLDERRAAMIHHPERTPDTIVGRYSAHLHMNLLPRVQGAGLGGRLLADWLGLVAGDGVSGVHVGANRANERAVRFWAKNGFVELDDENASGELRIWMARPLR